MIRFILGVALLPTAALTLLAAVQTLGGLALAAPSSWPLTCGALAAFALWFFAAAQERRGRGFGAGFLKFMRWFYVFGHELTHALAAWCLGAQVHGMEVGSEGGHVDLSRSGAFISLAPYCVPIYTLFVVAGYGALRKFSPDWANFNVFLGFVGLTLAGHLLMTAQCLWQRRQPDLQAAGGALFSLSVIVLANGFFMMILAKALFPRAVALADPLRRIAGLSAWFWMSGFHFAKELCGPLSAGRRP